MTDKERHEDETLKNCIQEAYGCSDDQLLAELAEIDKTLSESDFPGVEDRIMSRLKARMAEEETGKEIEVDSEADEVSVVQVEAPGSDTEAAPCTEVPEKKVVRIGKKKIALVAVLAAAFVGVLGVSASGGKHYFFSSWQADKGIIFNSGTNMTEVSAIESAYQEIEKAFGAHVLVLSYMPKGMTFESLIFDGERAIIQLSYNDNIIQFVQVKKSYDTSVGTGSDRKESHSIKNEWLNMDIYYAEHTLDSGEIEFESKMVVKDVAYWILGIVEREEFEKMLKYLNFR